MKTIIFLLLLIIPISAFGQEEIVEIIDPNKLENSLVSKIINAKSISEAEEYAKIDLNNNSLFLIVPGGIAPTIYASDFDFKHNYDVSMINFGCEPINDKLAAAYNLKVFTFLTDKYGTKWRKEIRDDVIGLKNSGGSE